MSFYREHILDHYYHPRNQGKLNNPTGSARGDNPLCGDEVEVFIRVKRGQIDDIRFKATGCAISIAAMSMLSEQIKGQTVSQARELSADEIKKMLGVELSVSRIKCAVLGLNTIKDCLKLE